MKEQDEKLQMARHGLAHVLAKALKRLFPAVKLTIGPAVDNGFYYDIDLSENIKESAFKTIEDEMKFILNKGEAFTKKIVSKKQAEKLFEGNDYKLELIREVPEGEKLSLYFLGNDFFDLCRGPHVESAKDLSNFGYKIDKINGAYWRGNEKNKMLQRVYVLAFKTKDELNKYVLKRAEAIAHDHNKIGRELEIFTTVDVIGQGLPVLLPKGAKIIQILSRFVEDEEEKRGYQLTKTPYMAKSDLYKISGHWSHYRDGMFVLGDEQKDKEVFALRPMTCPFQFQTYLNRPRSYRDLPMRLNETSTLFRNEASGEMHGLIRIRQFTISEGHIACLPTQLEDEFKGCLDLANFMLKTLGLDGDISYRLSKWDENNKDKYIGDKEGWEESQGILRKLLTESNIKFEEADGEAAYYGPKLDIQIKNVFGKEDTLITIQLDFQLAEKFGMEYTDADGSKKYPYILHRTSIGCYERVLAMLIEKFAGAFPLWLAPTQVRVLDISEKFNDYSFKILEKLKEEGLRAEIDIRSEKIGYKIREALSMKIPYLIIVGEEEEKSGTISIRGRGNENVSGVVLSQFIDRLKDEIASKKK